MKVCVVGGGSTYTPELIDGLLRRRAELDLHHVHLADIDADRLAVLGPLAARMAERAGGGVQLSWGTDRAQGLAGARFVVSQIRVGGMAARERDEQLGRRFGLVGQETVGVGGFANALRTIPVALDIARDVERHTPGATLLNFTNPAGLVTEALCRHSDVPTIGLCNEPWSIKARLAIAEGTDPSSVTFDYVGLNHLSWVRAVRIDGRDATTAVLARLRASLGEQRALGGVPAWTPAAIDLMDAIPNPYLRYYYETEAWVRRQAAHPTRASEVMAIEQALLDEYADPALDHKPAHLEQRGGAHYSEAAAALMADLVTGSGAEHVLNVPNRGAIPGLADDVVVEVSTKVGPSGPEVITVPPLREDMDALIRTVKDYELMTVQAAVHGDEDAALRALVTNPLGPPMSLAPAVWAALREANAGMLGRLS